MIVIVVITIAIIYVHDDSDVVLTWNYYLATYIEPQSPPLIRMYLDNSSNLSMHIVP